MWFEQQGQLDEAVDSILRTGQETDALQIIEPACEQAILNGNLQAILDWLAEWARVGFQPRGELLVYQGWIKALGGDFVQALMLAEQAEELLKPYARSKDKQIAATLQITQGKLAALHAFIDVMYTRQYDNALKQAKTAQRLLPKNRSAWTMMALGRRRELKTHRTHQQSHPNPLRSAAHRQDRRRKDLLFCHHQFGWQPRCISMAKRGEAIEVCQKALRHSSEADDPAAGGIYAWLGRMAGSQPAGRSASVDRAGVSAHTKIRRDA